jgi:tellurite resistance protein TehA-like permease
MAPSDAIGRIGSASARLPPGAFAFVMATGIVAIAARVTGMPRVALMLSWLTVGALVALTVALAHRLARHGRRAVADLLDHRVAAGYFTVPAGVCVAGTQQALVQGGALWSRRLLVVGAAAWLLVTYAFWMAMIIRRSKPALTQAVNGTWLVAVVATQAVSILASTVAPTVGEHGDALAFAALCTYLLGVALYAFVAPLLLYRLVFRDVTREGLAPDHWINMGAAAITALAGASLSGLGGLSVLESVRPLLVGATLLFWTVATWWIPLLVMLGLWRHGIRSHPIRYEARSWSLVFPLGMYPVATAHVADVFGLSALSVVAEWVAPVALGAWLLTFAGLLRAGLRHMRGVTS